MEINDFRDMGRMYVSDLDPADVFEYDNKFYLTTEDRQEGKVITAVRLDTGEIIHLDGRTAVTYIEKVEVIFRD